MARLKIGSKLIDPIQLATYEAIARVALNHRVPFIIVGASARDLVMHHAYGAPVQERQEILIWLFRFQTGRILTVSA
ncbi:MAG: hypothetical protein WD623_07980 [Marinobacter sp.]|uniref:hypothetical protein n=1 Tax=Marinobacter sp. TaxID=50741 RepID=UPI0034A04F6C